MPCGPGLKPRLLRKEISGRYDTAGVIVGDGAALLRPGT